MTKHKNDEGWEQGFWPSNQSPHSQTEFPRDPQLDELAQKTAPEQLISDKRREFIMAEALQALLPEHAHDDSTIPDGAFDLARKRVFRRRWLWMTGAGLAASVLLSVWIVKPVDHDKAQTVEVATHAMPQHHIEDKVVVTPESHKIVQPSIKTPSKATTIAKTIVIPKRSKAQLPSATLDKVIQNASGLETNKTPENRQLASVSDNVNSNAPHQGLTLNILSSTTNPSSHPQVLPDPFFRHWEIDENGKFFTVFMTPHRATIPNLDTVIPTLQAQLHNHARSAWRLGFTSIPASSPDTMLDDRSSETKSPMVLGMQVRVIPRTWKGQVGKVIRVHNNLWAVKSWKLWPVFSNQTLENLKWIAAYQSNGGRGDAVVFAADDKWLLAEIDSGSTEGVSNNLILEVAMTDFCTQPDCLQKVVTLTEKAKSQLFEQYPDLIFVGETVTEQMKDAYP